MRRENGVCSYNAADECCGRCLANRSNRPFSDTRPSAKWMETAPLSNENLLERLRSQEHPLAMCRQAKRFFYGLDAIHVLDHHGVCAIVVASTLRKVVKSHAPFGPTQEARLGVINAKLKRHNRVRKPSAFVNRIAMRHLTLNGWAELHGPVIKASVCRHLATFRLEIATECFTSGSSHDMAERQANESLNALYDTMYGASNFLLKESMIVSRARSPILELLSLYYAACIVMITTRPGKLSLKRIK